MNYSSMYTDGKCLEASVYMQYITHTNQINSVDNLYNGIKNPRFNIANTRLQIEPVHSNSHHRILFG